jgi:2-polyprenyl-3-methyl-5-hydroxy-6-metoxy-1,4-benzoquinol methylase
MPCLIVNFESERMMRTKSDLAAQPESAMTNSHTSGTDSYFVERISGARDLPFFPDHLARYSFAMQWAPGHRVLDVCCGVGYGSFVLASAGASAVLGIDIAEEAIGAARTQPPLPNLSFAIHDACVPYPNAGSWDLVTCFEGIEHVPDPKKLVANVHGALQPGGVAIVSSPNSDGYAKGHSGNPFHPSEMKESEFRSLIDALPWRVEWYAQIAQEAVWQRPRWQQNLIRALPTALRDALRSGKSSAAAGASEVLWRRGADGGKAPEIGLMASNDWYPRPWDEAVKVMYEPPPHIIIAVCRRVPKASI